jgi:hypothetical protein
VRAQQPFGAESRGGELVAHVAGSHARGRG